MARLIACVSFAHVSLCYLYLYFLYSGFGSGVSDLFRATDVLSVGLGKLLPFYIMFILGNVLNHLWMIDRPFQIVRRENFFVHESIDKPIFRYSMISICVLAPAMQILAYLTGRPILLIALFFPLIFAISWIVARAFTENNIAQKYRLWSVLVFIGVLQVTTGAYAQGFSARHHEYGRFDEAPMVCGGAGRLLFTVGDYFIVVEESGIRKAIARDCTEKLVFRRRVPTVDIHPI